MKKISAVWAQDQNGVIGKNGTLPWSLPADLAHFKETTTGHVMVMGRVTFDGMGQRALPNRISIILTRDVNYQVDNERVLVMHTVEEVLAWYQEQEKNLYVVGGGQIFEVFAPYVDEIVLTDIHAAYEGDTTMPAIFNWSDYQQTVENFREKDEKNEADFTVKVFEKKV